MAAGHLLRLLRPARGVVFAGLAALFLLAIEEVRSGAAGPWIEIGAGALAALCLLAAGLFVATALRRRRDGLARRALGWGIGAAWAVLAAALALEVVVQAVQLRSALSGADVHLTAPMLHALPRPPGATLVDERPGPSGTQSITDDVHVLDLASVPAFYRGALPGAGWIEDSAGNELDLLRFHKGQFDLTILLDTTGAAPPQQPGDYAVTVDQAPPPTSPS
jgi:hypothetical protein